MTLVKLTESVEFDLELLRAGGFLRAKHKSWRDFRNGLIVIATREKLHVAYQPMRGALSYFAIKAVEVTNDEWLIRYSDDLKEVTECGEFDTQEDGE